MPYYVIVNNGQVTHSLTAISAERARFQLKPKISQQDRLFVELGPEPARRVNRVPYFFFHSVELFGYETVLTVEYLHDGQHVPDTIANYTIHGVYMGPVNLLPGLKEEWERDFLIACRKNYHQDLADTP